MKFGLGWLYDTLSKKCDTQILRLYKVNETFYYRRRYKNKLFRISLRTKHLKEALYRKKLLDFVKGDDYELIFEYDMMEEFKE